MAAIPQELVQRLFLQVDADRWQLPIDRFAEKLALSASRTFPTEDADPVQLERYLASLHLADLALASACEAGNEAAWEHFVQELRPVLYRAADAIEPGGGARELADSLYADLFGLQMRDGMRQSLFRYFHGRSSLATWLRAVLAQRYVDRVRSQRRIEVLPQDHSPAALSAPHQPLEPERERYLRMLRQALGRTIAALPSRDRIRLGCYYGQELTLKQIGKLLGEHEATVSRHLARTRTEIRRAVEQHLRDDGLSDAEMTRCFEVASEDAGPIDLRDLLDDQAAERKKVAWNRSPEEKMP